MSGENAEAAPAGEPAQEVAAATPEVPVPPVVENPMAKLAEMFPELSGRALMAIAETMTRTKLEPEDARQLTAAKEPKLFAKADAPPRSGTTATTPTTGQATPPRRAPTALEKVQMELEAAGKGLMEAVSEDDRIGWGGLLIAARRKYRTLAGPEALN